MGTYLRVLAVLGLEEDLNALAADDKLGRKLQDLALLAKYAHSEYRAVHAWQCPGVREITAQQIGEWNNPPMRLTALQQAAVRATVRAAVAG